MKLLFSFVVLFFLSLSNTTQALFLPNKPNKPNMDEFTLNMYDLFNLMNNMDDLLMNNMDDLNDDLNTGQFVLQADGESIYRFNLNMDKFNWEAFTNEENIQEHIENIKKHGHNIENMLKYIYNGNQILNDLESIANDLANDLDLNTLDNLLTDPCDLTFDNTNLCDLTVDTTKTSFILYVAEFHLTKIKQELEHYKTGIIKSDLSSEMIQLAEETIVRYQAHYPPHDIIKNAFLLQSERIEKIEKQYNAKYYEKQLEKMKSKEFLTNEVEKYMKKPLEKMNSKEFLTNEVEKYMKMKSTHKNEVEKYTKMNIKSKEFLTNEVEKYIKKQLEKMKSRDQDYYNSLINTSHSRTPLTHDTSYGSLEEILY